MKQTPLYSCHVAQNAHMVEFGEWQMPMHYGSQIQEHLATRRQVGMFDVSHMVVTDIDGRQAYDFLRNLLSNDIAKIKPNQALYSCLLHHEGGVLDDLIVYQLADNAYRLITNSTTRDKITLWLNKLAQNFQINVQPYPHYALIAVQGPKAIESVCQQMASGLQVKLNALKPFTALQAEDCFIARTGYTGEPGVEILLPAEAGVALWKKFSSAGVSPCGLGARDTLRQEAGLNLYGQEMDEMTNPYEANLGFTVDLSDPSRNFIGKAAVTAMQVQSRLVGLVGDKSQIMRRHAKVILSDNSEGVVTSGTYSPSLDCAIAFARIPNKSVSQVEVTVRRASVQAQVVKLPFLRQGQATFAFNHVLQS